MKRVIIKTIIPPIPSHILVQEVAALPATCQLMERGKFRIFLAKVAHIPNLLQEIGRLRELTFRSVGEGTGKSVDLDEFDNYYYNLFIWDLNIESLQVWYINRYRCLYKDEYYSTTILLKSKKHS